MDRAKVEKALSGHLHALGHEAYFQFTQMREALLNEGRMNASLDQAQRTINTFFGSVLERNVGVELAKAANFATYADGIQELAHALDVAMEYKAGIEKHMFASVSDVFNLPETPRKAPYLDGITIGDMLLMRVALAGVPNRETLGQILAAAGQDADSHIADEAIKQVCRSAEYIVKAHLIKTPLASIFQKLDEDFRDPNKKKNPERFARMADSMLAVGLQQSPNRA